MAFSIRMKLIHKDTGLTFKEKNVMPVINMDGQPSIVDFSDFYLSHKLLKSSEWELYVAISKDKKGQWIYQKIGE